MLKMYFRSDPAAWLSSEEIADLDRLSQWLQDSARCDDPLVGYVCGLADGEYSLPHSESADATLVAQIGGLADSHYPTQWRLAMIAGLFLARDQGFTYREGDHRSLSVELLDGFETLLKSDIYAPSDLGRVARSFLAYRQLIARNPFSGMQVKDRKPEFDRLFAQMDSALGGTAWPLLLKGSFYIDYAWSARGNDIAARVPPDALKLFRERSEIAHEALVQAYRLDPHDPEAPTTMLTVMLALGDRQEMETWFQRAMAADPDNLRACLAKLHYLEPRWYGDPRAMLQFARDCQAEGNYRGQVAFLPAMTHEDLSNFSKDPATYLGSAPVWHEVRANFEEGLPIAPRSWNQHTLYGGLAIYAGEWKTADEQFSAAGGRDVSVNFVGPKSRTELLEMLKQHSGG